MRLCTLLVLLCVVSTSLCQTLEQETCDADRSMVDINVNNADVLLGGIFNMRVRGSDGYGCGGPHLEEQLAFEASKWAINKINTENYINGVRMGMKAYDVCTSRNRALAAVNSFYPQFSTSSMYCNQTNKYNLGILGPMLSVTTEPVAELASKFPASVISPLASAPDLSDKKRFPYFMRTRASASEQIQAMIAAMKLLGWERVLFVYMDNYYGLTAMDEMIRLTQNDNVCVVQTVALPSKGNTADFIDKLKDIGNYDVSGAAFFGTHLAAVGMLEAVDQVSGAEDIQWMLSYLDMNDPILPGRMKGAVLVQPTFTEVTEFYDYFTSINENNPPADNPWYQDWFMSTFRCRLQGINYAPYATLSDCTPKSAAQKRLAINTRYAFVDATIKAVYAYAEALRTAHAQTCGSASGMCLGLRQMTPQQFQNYLRGIDLDMSTVNINSLQGLRVRFDQNGDFYTSAYTFWNYNDQPSGGFAFKDIGTFVDNVLNLDASRLFMYNGARTSVLPSLPSSPCPAAGCRNCVVQRPMVHFTYTPGDIVLAGLFDIHTQGSEVLLCGALRATHALNGAAFRYAIQRVKQNFPGILNGVDLGSLVVDMCDNGETGRLLLNNLLGGRHVIDNVDPNLVQTVVGELDSTEAISMASMLAQYSMPYIDSSATSVYLYDRYLFPTFTRAIPSDYHQMLAIVLMLKRMNWNYVQVIYSGDAYGHSGNELIRSEGAKHSICVAASHEIGIDGSHEQIISKLKQKADARVVVAIVDTDDHPIILKAIRDQNLEGQFVLIGSETWGQRNSVVSGYETVAEGSISIDIVPPQMVQFRQWLGSLNPTDPDIAEEMPFFAEWYQYAFSCYLDATNRGTYSNQCNPTISITQAPRYEESSYAAFTIYATYAAARALDETIRDFCGDGVRNYNGLCWEFRSSADVKKTVLQYLSSSEFVLDGYPFKMKSGEGMANFDFYSYSNGQYVRIGTYDTEGAQLQLDFTNPPSLPMGFSSSCTRCSECVYLVQSQPYAIINEDAELQLGFNFALRNPGLDPFLCGPLRMTNGIQSFLAAGFAMDEINRGNGPFVLNDVKVGGLLLDHCNSRARAYGLPSALYSGILGAEEPRPNLNAIRAWVTDNTLVTEEMKDFFSDFNLPVISQMATTNKFLNEEEYPTFLRTIQGDSTIASALAILAKSLGLQYVTVLYAPYGFGRSGKDTFQAVAMQEGLCIIKMVEMDAGNIDAIVADLIEQPTHVVITYLDIASMETFLQARGRNDDGDDLVVISPEPFPLVYNRQGVNARNLLSLRMRTNTLDMFRDYLSRISVNIPSGDHPLLSSYYMELFQCNLPGEYRYATSCPSNLDIVDSPNFYTDNYVLPIINAVNTFVGAAHETLKIQCGDDYKGVCSKFYSDPNTNTILRERMTQVSYIDQSGATFTYIGKEGNTGREIVLFDGTQMRKVADFAGASINIIDRDLVNMFETTRSSCNSPCLECVNNNMNFTYIPGDVMLGGLFDVHESGLTPFSCGEINTIRGFQLLEAFHFAIDKVNEKSGQFANVLKNVKLGGIGLDACQSAVKGGYLVSNIQNGLSVLQRDDTVINPDEIEAYIGTYTSGTSIYLARLLKSLNIPQVSFGASSYALLDDDRYPYFLRTVPADDKQAMGMIKFLRNYDVRYVQIVHTASNYGEQGAEIFNRLAYDEKICVAQTVSFLPQSTVTNENANDVILALLQKPVANTIVVFAEIDFINALLHAVRRNPDAQGKFKFIGSGTWANNPEAIDDVEDIALGSVTLDLDVVDIRDFDEYLSTKTPANYPENPWFPEYYEKIQNCYLTIPNTKYPGRCSATPKNIVTSRRYKQDTALIHVINAVYSSAYGLDLALKEECGDNYTTVCEAFKTRSNRREFVLEKIKQSSFQDLSGQPFSFSPSRGDGNKGYVFYSIDSSNILGYTYNPIGKYSSAGALTMTQSTYMPSWDGSCDREDSCTECPTIRNPLTRYMLPTYADFAANPNPATLVYMTKIHNQGADEYRCGSMDMPHTLQALAVLYTVKYSNLVIDKPFNLRPLILDHCDNQLRIDQDLFNLLTTGNLCNTNFSSAGSVIDKDTVMGVQVQSSRFVVAANRVTAPLKIQLMSGTASSTALSDTWRYPYFARTVPPDNIQMELIARILKRNGWSYIGVIYTKESYGINAYRDLQTAVNEGEFSCIGAAEGIDNPTTVEEVRPIVRRIAETEGIGVIVLIVLDPRPILEAIIAEGLAPRFIVIGTDAWGTDQSVTRDLAGRFAGAITIDFRNAFYNDFVQWMKSITYTKRMEIPDDWFDEFYQHIHECHLTNSNVRLTQYTDPCDTNAEFITDEKVKFYTPRLTNIAAAYALGNGLSKLYRDFGCAGESFADCMAGIDNSRDILFGNTLEQTWNILRSQVDPADTFNLEIGDDRYWNIGYHIFALLRNNTYNEIGSQSLGNGFQFNLDGSYDNGHPGLVSRCPEGQYCDCAFDDGQTTQQVAENVTKPKYMRDHEPRNYFMYDEDTGEQVYDWPIWAIATAVLSCIGLFVGIVLFFYFLFFYPVRGGTTILGFLTMLGLFGVYATNFAFFLPAAEDTCAARQFLMGVVYAVVFAPLFVKAVDNWRFKDAEYSTKRYLGLTNPCALVLIALGIILVQCIIPIEWLTLRNPSASLMDDSTNQHDWMWCDPHDFYDISMVLSMSYVVFLVIMTAIFSALAWDSESNYFESRWIFVSCVCTAGCFLVWMVVTTNAGPPYRDPAVAIANFVNATALLLFIPIRKLVLLIQFSSEEEKAKTMPSDDMDPNNELYSSVYTNQMYQNQAYQPDVFQADQKQDSDGGY